jgi:hypothetical protein
MDRREFLGVTGVLTGLLAAGSPLALLAPSRAWALDLKALTSDEGTTLLAAARTIAPHDKLDDWIALRRVTPPPSIYCAGESPVSELDSRQPPSPSALPH